MNQHWNEYEWLKQLDTDEISYLENLPHSISIPELNLIIVHAGLMPNIELTEQNPNDLMFLRNIIEHDNFLESFYGEEKGIEWIKKWQGPQHIFFGHDAIRKLQNEFHATGLDTGCCYGNQLTGCILELNIDPILNFSHKGNKLELDNKHFIQVDAHEQYYQFPVFKNEK